MKFRLSYIKATVQKEYKLFQQLERSKNTRITNWWQNCYLIKRQVRVRNAKDSDRKGREKP
jgi:hypothetical protein